MKYTHYERQKRWLAKNPGYIKKWKEKNPGYHRTYSNEWTRTFVGHASQLYSYLKRRIKSNKYYKGLTAISRQEFTSWCLENSDYKRLHILWVESGYNPNMSPSVNRKDTRKGYIFGNIEIITKYQNNLGGCKTMTKNRWKRV